MAALLPLLAGSSAAWSAAFWFVPYVWMTDVNAWGCGVLSVLSLCELTPELWTVAWVCPYFVLDSVRCVRDREWTYVIHHVLSLCMLGFGASEPHAGITNRGASRVLLVEWSALLLAHWNRDRSSRLRFAVLLIGYFLNRIVYLGHLAWCSRFSAAVAADTQREVAIIWGLRLLHVLMTTWFLLLLRKARRYSWCCGAGTAAQGRGDAADGMPLVAPEGIV